MENTSTSIFKELYDLNVNEHTEKKNDLTYLSWSWAIAEILKRYPDFTYEILRFENNLPYVYDEKTGYMVFTRVTINGITREMWLPVMNGANKAMLDHEYTYKTKQWNKFTKQNEEKENVVAAATMFDINKTIMRCLTKNLAMFGLGLYIYAGEDLPEVENDTEPKNENEAPELKKDETVATNAFDLKEYCLKLGIDLENEKIKSWLIKQVGTYFDSVAELNEDQYRLYDEAVRKLINSKKK